ncbi:MAG: hypothetical protein K5882_03735 [Bacteroidales bacterium]|nr:hypothetical protein [Bacteroidales bacterium]
MYGNNKIRGRQIETDDFIKSVRNNDVDWNNDVDTASQKAIFDLISSSGGVTRITETQYDALATKDRKTLYAVTDKNDRLVKIYIGSTLIARADESQNCFYDLTFRVR